MSRMAVCLALGYLPLLLIPLVSLPLTFFNAVNCLAIALVLAHAVRMVQRVVSPVGKAVIYALPWGMAFLVHIMQKGLGSVMTVDFLEMTYGYIGATSLWYGKTMVVLGLLALGFVLRYKKRWNLLSCAAVTVVYVYAFGLVLVYGDYYHPRVAYSFKEWNNQAGLSTQPWEMPLQTVRHLEVDAQEKFLYVGFQSSDRGPNHPKADGKRSGLLKWDLGAGRKSAFYEMAMGDKFALDEEDGKIYVSDLFGEKEVLELSMQDLRYTGRSFHPLRPPDSLALLGRKLVVELEVPHSAPDVYALSLNDFPRVLMRSVAPEARTKILNAALCVLPDRQQVAILQFGKGTTDLVLISENADQERISLGRGAFWEVAYDQKRQVLIMPCLSRSLMKIYNLQTKSFSTYAIPRAVREVAVSPQGLWALADYRRGKVYLYNPENQAIANTIWVGPKPEGLAWGPKTGTLYVASDWGLTALPPK